MKKLEQLGQSCRDVVLFGTMSMAMIAYEVCQHLNKRVLGFCDNDTRKQGQTIFGKKVLSFGQLCGYQRHTDIYICALTNKSITEIETQLRNAGFYNITTYEPILYAYQCEIKKRPITWEQFAETAEALKSQKVTLRNLGLFITTRCTLRCENCGALIPEYTHPQDYNTQMLIDSLQSLDQSVDGIESIGIMGGEPFLHKDLIEICKAASAVKKARIVYIVTNGTILPDDEILKWISKLGIIVTISNYGGSISKAVKPFTEKLKEYHIAYELYEAAHQWFQCSLPDKKNRSYEQNCAYYQKCFIAKKCPMLQNGRLYICGYHSNAAELQAYTEQGDECVDLLDDTATYAQKKQKIYDLFYSRPVIKICDYCELCEEKLVERASQAVGER